ncbi:TetR/AcrR family transcriptional regulator [Kibdelosporangium philippinense]|uniref:TetR/AcrR family transcriptional regulator n=1 Tax=Kibdelosporangium philippinense TaxID=211113 RepID=A0ABS8ZKU0_9PSEU|nr:TetR/AcrR family transcriptional regulator [Kibdelosporangium philippinense]MCE7008406.1 TetR/AcrR family transcriptional regulator [Kibdelosporangium philippinense]
MGERVKGQGDARRERWREHRAARREEFVEAALRALAEHGPDLGMDHVAQAAGVTKPVLYRHFTDKADLFVALGQRGTEILFERLIPAINREEAPVPRIRKSLDAFFGVIEDYPNLYRLLARRSFGDRPVDSDPVREDKELIAAALTSLLGDYMRALNLDSGAAEPWAYSIVGMVQTTGEWWLERRSMSRDAIVEYLTTIIWAAIDGFLRQHNVQIAPDKPFEVNKVVQLRRIQ